MSLKPENGRKINGKQGGLLNSSKKAIDEEKRTCVWQKIEKKTKENLKKESLLELLNGRKSEAVQKPKMKDQSEIKLKDEGPQSQPHLRKLSR